MEIHITEHFSSLCLPILLQLPLHCGRFSPCASNARIPTTVEDISDIAVAVSQVSELTSYPGHHILRNLEDIQ